MTEFLIKRGRIGCVPGVDFGPVGEGHVRFCFARDRGELTGAIESMDRALKLESSGVRELRNDGVPRFGD
jgi:aspartate/methionine/tyrosine aminotransferase